MGRNNEMIDVLEVLEMVSCDAACATRQARRTHMCARELFLTYGIAEMSDVVQIAFASTPSRFKGYVMR